MVQVDFTASGTFTPPAGVTSVDVLVVGGGGGGGQGGSSFNNPGGGGGGGAVIWQTGVAVTPGVGCTVTVGAAGTCPTQTTSDQQGNNGGASSFVSTTGGGTTVTAPGGGGGGGGTAAGTKAGKNGACGGGGATQTTTGAVTAGVGNHPGFDGGAGAGSSTTPGRKGGGGGGYGAAGVSGSTSVTTGNGGDGVDMSANVGTSVGDAGWFGGGGGGGVGSGAGGNYSSGGRGGGGRGVGPGTGQVATAAIANSGGGGGGGGVPSSGSVLGTSGAAGRVIVVYVVAAPNVPTSVSAGSIGTNSIDLSWSAPSGGGSVTSYDVRLNGGAASTATSPHTFSGLTPATTYTLEVRAVGPGGTSAWVSVSATTLGPPNVPSAVSATTVSHTHAVLTWSPPVGGTSVTSYDVRLNGGAASTATSPHDFTGLTPGTAYTLEVRAVGPGGTSAWVSVAITTLAATEPAYYRVTLDIGSHSFEVSTRDEPGYGVVLPLSLGWQVPETDDYFPAQADLTTLTFALQAATPDEYADIVKGSTVIMRMYVDDAPDAELWQHFDGVVTQLDGGFVRSSTDASRFDFRLTVYAADDNARLADKYVGYTADWPIEHIDERVDRIVSEAGITGGRDSFASIAGTGMAGWLPARAASSGPVSALSAIRAALRDAADDYTSEPPFEFYGRYVFAYAFADRSTTGLFDGFAADTLYVGVFRRRVFDTTTIDGGFVRVDGQWSKQPGPASATWAIVDGTVFGTPDSGPPVVRNTGLLDYTGTPPGSDLNYSATERDSLGESLVAGDSTALDGWSSRTLVYECATVDDAGLPADLSTVTEWASYAPLYQVIPVVVTPVDALLDLNGVGYLAGTLTAARLVIPPGGKFRIEFRLRAEVLPGTDLP